MESKRVDAAVALGRRMEALVRALETGADDQIEQACLEVTSAGSTPELREQLQRGLGLRLCKALGFDDCIVMNLAEACSSDGRHGCAIALAGVWELTEPELAGLVVPRFTAELPERREGCLQLLEAGARDPERTAKARQFALCFLHELGESKRAVAAAVDNLRAALERDDWDAVQDMAEVIGDCAWSELGPERSSGPPSEGEAEENGDDDLSGLPH